jgi:hypothetical protein
MGLTPLAERLFFCDAGTLQKEVSARTSHTRGEKTHEVHNEIVHALVMVPEPRARIRERGLFMLSVS